jgi:hypothetical protein
MSGLAKELSGNTETKEDVPLVRSWRVRRKQIRQYGMLLGAQQKHHHIVSCCAYESCEGSAGSILQCMKTEFWKKQKGVLLGVGVPSTPSHGSVCLCS